MSTELKRMTPSRAMYFMERFKREEKLLGPNEQAALTYVINMLEKATAIQQAEAQQPAIPEGWVPCIVTYEGQHPEEVAYGPQRMMERLKKWLDRYFEMKVVQQPATGEPAQADSSEHLRVIASLGAALRRLSFAAQTTGGTDGPDAELQSAIGQAEQALSLGGIWQAMSATPEPVVDVRCEGCGYMTHHREHIGCVRAAKQHTNPAPSVLKDDQIAALVNKVRDIARMFNAHRSLRERIAIELVPALKASQEVKSNAERWLYAIADGGNQSMNFIDIFDDWDGDGDFVEVFDAARLADKAGDAA